MLGNADRIAVDVKYFSGSRKLRAEHVASMALRSASIAPVPLLVVTNAALTETARTRADERFGSEPIKFLTWKPGDGDEPVAAAITEFARRR